MRPIIHTEQTKISDDLTIVKYWFDRSNELPGYRIGVDENFPETGLYQNDVLVSTVYWSNTVTLEMIESFLNTSSQYQLRPSLINIPESI